MNRNSSLWLETRIAARELANSVNSSAEARDQISQYAGIFVTHYLAIHYQTELEPEEYEKQRMISGNPSAMDVNLPPQSIFKLAIEAADAFLEGYINPSVLERFVFSAYTDARPTLYPLAQMENLNPIKTENLNGIVKSIISLLSMSTILVAGVKDNGLVKSIPPEGRRLAKAMIDDSFQQASSIRHKYDL